MIRKSALAVALATTCLTFAAQAKAADAPATAPDASGVDEIVVIATGGTRSVSSVQQVNLQTLPPGTSAQKVLNLLPGVSAGSIDALGLNEQSMTLQVRGFSSTHLGYTLDGMPLGDGAYNNYNGLTISRALISDNLGRADLATGIAGLGIASTSNLGGAVIYTSSDPRKVFGVEINETYGSGDAHRTFARFDTGEHNGFAAYVSGHYTSQDLFVNQGAGKRSTEGQFNGKATYSFDRGQITAFADISRTNQADDAYISKDIINRDGWMWGGYAPDWNTYLTRAACPSLATPIKCVNPAAPEKAADDTYTNGQILRDDDLYYVAGDYDLTRDLKAHLQVYHHTDKGGGNNFISGISTQRTATTADDLPVQIRDTRYSIDRTGVLGNLGWTVGFNHIQGGFWIEDNTSSAARYLWLNVTGPSSLAQYLQGQPDQGLFAQQTKWKTQQFYLQDTVSLLQDALSLDFGFKSTDATADATAVPGVAMTSAMTSSQQFATGSLHAKDNFLPEVGARWRFAPGHELYASYAENMAMYQGGFKLGPQSVSQAVWNAQGSTLKPETSKSIDVGYRYVAGRVQVSLAGYHVNFENRLLQYNPCPTALQANPGCGNSFHNAGSVTSNGAEFGVLFKATSWLDWYNSASFNQTTYDDNLKLLHHHLRALLHGRQAAGGHAQAAVLQRVHGEAGRLLRLAAGQVHQPALLHLHQRPELPRLHHRGPRRRLQLRRHRLGQERQAVDQRHQPDRRALRGQLRQQRVRAQRPDRRHHRGPRRRPASGLRHVRAEVLSVSSGARSTSGRQAVADNRGGLFVLARVLPPPCSAKATQGILLRLRRQDLFCEARRAKQNGGRGRDRTDMTEAEDFKSPCVYQFRHAPAGHGAPCPESRI